MHVFYTSMFLIFDAFSLSFLIVNTGAFLTLKYAISMLSRLMELGDIYWKKLNVFAVSLYVADLYIFNMVMHKSVFAFCVIDFQSSPV